jgi:N-acyl-D-aspartate/D-glutamate deacylase
MATALADRGATLGGEVWPQVACLPLSQIFNFADPFPLLIMPAFREVLAVGREQRLDIYADASWRERARPEIDDKWKHLYQSSTVERSPAHPELEGCTIVQAAERRSTTCFDLMVDLSLEDKLETRFRAVFSNDDEEEVGALLRDDRTVLGLSDAGAHASQICDARFSTHLLSHWTRETGVLTLEQAVRRLTAHAAGVFRREGRGRIEPGAFADLVAFDADTVGSGPLERVWDLPAGADRLVCDSVGIEHVWVNGTCVRADGKNVDGARPGVLMRGGAA